MATIDRVRAALNPRLEIEGVLLTMYDDRTNLGQQVSANIREHFGDKVYRTVIPRNVRLGEAPSHGVPVILYDARSRGADAYVGLAKRIPRPRARRRRRAQGLQDARRKGHRTMAEKRPALGRGLSALIPRRPAHRRRPPPMPRRRCRRATRRHAAPPKSTSICLVPNPRQPRAHSTRAHLEELAHSIRQHGVIQPILVRQVEHRYEIVAGERRWRAAQRAGLLKVPVVIREVPDDKLLEVALVENIQREDLNPIEEAQAYRRLTDDLQLSQEAVAAAVGKDRATVANYMRLLRLPVEVRNDLASGAITMGHARALLSLADEAAQRRVARDIVARGLSVRETEGLVRREGAPPRAPRSAKRRQHARRRRSPEARARHPRPHHPQSRRREDRDRLQQ